MDEAFMRIPEVRRDPRKSALESGCLSPLNVFGFFKILNEIIDNREYMYMCLEITMSNSESKPSENCPRSAFSLFFNLLGKMYRGGNHARHRYRNTADFGLLPDAFTNQVLVCCERMGNSTVKPKIV
jgi:hypothetical protein